MFTKSFADVVHIVVDHQIGFLVESGLLQIDDHNFAGNRPALLAEERQLSHWIDLQGRTCVGKMRMRMGNNVISDQTDLSI